MKRVLGLLVVLLAATGLSLGQVTTVNGGSIQGTITDPSGAIIPQANLTVVADDTGTTRKTVTDGSGLYVVGPLVPGKYTVKVEKAGFTGLSVKTVIRTGTVTNGNYKLSIGESTTTVEVDAGSLQINTDQTSVSDVITSEQIKQLPVNGRNFLDLAQIEPGVILQSGESFDPTKAGYSAISVGGVSGRSTRILLDGQDITDETVGTTIFNVSQGAINEFQLNRSNQDVSGDVTSTGQVLVSTNSGTNKFHGQAFYNFQDHRSLFARSTNGEDPQFQRNQFGGSIGGPIIKDKLYFFGNSERIKQDSSAVSPINASGIFGNVYNQFTTIGTPYRETYSTARLDYDGPLHGHYFVRANYNVNAVTSNYGYGYWLYANRDNTPGIAGGADYQFGHFTHSFRISYEKFHNLISDQTAGNSSIYNPLPGFAFYNTTQRLYAGPNYLAPQGTFQSDKQFRYDGSWTKGQHTVRFGYSLNRILGGGFAAFFGLSPRVSENAASLLDHCKGDGVSAPCPNDPVNGYHPVTAIIGNGQGAFTEHPGFGLDGGGVFTYRQGAYIADSWKVTPTFTLTAGVRWSADTNRANQDLSQVLCSDINNPNLDAPCSGNQSLFAQWDPSLGGKVHQPWANFGPQIGFVYSPGDHKTAFRGGFGIYYENDVFNNTTNARNALLKSGAFFDDKSFCNGTYSVVMPDGTSVSSVNGVSLQSLCNSSMAVAAPAFIQLQQMYQANTKANSQLANGAYIGQTLTAQGIYGAPYRTPYAEQWSFGVQRELGRGIIISADYIHNSTLKISQYVDYNHIGAARYLDAAAARSAIAATTSAAGCTGGASAGAINCAIASGATIDDFANNGLDSGNQVLGGNPVSYYNGDLPAAAFPGRNSKLGNGQFLMPIGRSGYDALQIVFKQSKTHPAPGINSVNIQGSYSLSRVVSSYGSTSNGTSDQFFSGASWDNDDPNQYMGRASLDRKHQMTMAAIFNMKYGPRVALTGQFRSSAPANLTLDSQVETAGIFKSDVTGDGTIGDLAPGTLPGAYMHDVKPGSLQNYVTSFNQTKANTLTPAGQALVAAGLLTPQQMRALGGTIQPIAALPQQSAIANPTFRNVDASFSYPVSLAKLREGMSLEPVIAFYNVFNMANYSSLASGILENTTSAGGTVNSDNNYLTGPNTYDVVNANRSQRGSGTFNGGNARTTEFQLKLNF